ALADTLTHKPSLHDALPILGTDNSTLDVSAYTVNDGNSGGNYAVTTHTHTGTITRAPLDISAVGDTKVYDGTVSSAGVPTVSGLDRKGTSLNSSESHFSYAV